MKKYILIEIEEELKNEFSSVCKAHNIKPMGLLIVFISLFTSNDIDRNKFIDSYKDYKESINAKKRKLLQENRITGDVAHKLSQLRKVKRYVKS